MVDMAKARRLLAQKKQQGYSGLTAKGMVSRELGCTVMDLSDIVYSSLSVVDSYSTTYSGGDPDCNNNNNTQSYGNTDPTGGE